jgi:uncharacterized membrane protein
MEALWTVTTTDYAQTHAYCWLLNYFANTSERSIEVETKDAFAFLLRLQEKEIKRLDEIAAGRREDENTA